MLYLKGISMGGADVIPGVSGGTIAFITGIYDELINSLKAIDLIAFNLLLQLNLTDLWKKVNGTFLLTVLLGIITSLLSLAKLMTFLIREFPVQTWSFFMGLILVSSIIIFRTIRKWNARIIAMVIIGVIGAYIITILSPTQTSENYAFIFFCGSLAICAMILPGISGAFILLLLGKYEYMINALISFNWLTIIVFASGCVVGLVSFSKLLSWLLSHYRAQTVAVLAGFMLGSLNKVWPWKEVIAYRINHLGMQVPSFDQSILPFRYFEITGNDPHLIQAILFLSLGILLVVGIEKTAAYLKPN